MSLLKVFPLYFKMAKSSENLDNILRGQAKDKVQRSLAQALNRYEKQAEQIKPFLLEKESEKILQQSQVSSRARLLNQAQNW